jgi:hypothetical protein
VAWRYYGCVIIEVDSRVLPMADFPLYPKHPERICWGCDKYCPAEDMCCGNGTIRAPHPVELFGEDWVEWLEKHEHPDEETAPAA